jgi:hypothetical protein
MGTNAKMDVGIKFGRKKKKKKKRTQLQFLFLNWRIETVFESLSVNNFKICPCSCICSYVDDRSLVMHPNFKNCLFMPKKQLFPI